MFTKPDDKHAKSKRRGRRVKMSTTELGAFIQKQLDNIGMTRAQLAVQLHVSSSTIGRLLNGDTQVVQRVSSENLCAVLRLDDMNRREFFKLVAAAGATTFSLPTGSTTAKLIKYKIDLDLAEDHAVALERLLEQGDNAHYAMESGWRWYNRLIEEQPYEKDTRLAAIQLRFGLFLAGAQEFILPWNQRSQAAIQTYNQIESAIICRFSLNTFRQEYAYLLSHRAPLYRELGNYRESAKQYEDGIFWSQRAQASLLHATLLRNRIHNSATAGDEIKWRSLLHEARREAQRMDPTYAEGVLAMLMYIEAEGYKRLAFNARKELPRSVRIQYAHRALRCFALAQEAIERYPESHNLIIQLQTERNPMAHYYLAQVSQAQCMILIDPEEAIRRIERMRDNLPYSYPALPAKVNHTLYFAQQQLQNHGGNPLLLFGLDAR